MKAVGRRILRDDQRPRSVFVRKMSLDAFGVIVKVGADGSGAKRADTLPSEYRQKMVLVVPLLVKIVQNNPPCRTVKRKG